MRLSLIILFFSLALCTFGQDSLQIDTSSSTLPPRVKDSVIIDSLPAKVAVVPIKKKKKKALQPKYNKLDTVQKARETEFTSTDTGNNKDILTRILVFVTIVGLVIFLLTFLVRSKRISEYVANEQLIPDDIKRKLMSRQDYYRNVYLKSEAWKRKRHLVLKRDNWRCVYCGGHATEVHHTRYAKINIGKEPIEWLVSICRPCHDSKHQ